MMGSSVEFACLLLMVSTLGRNHLASGGCAGKCCRSRDLSCLTTDWRMDRVYGTCYCDMGCIRTKDCCFDYFTECPGEGMNEGAAVGVNESQEEILCFFFILFFFCTRLNFMTPV